MDNDQRENGSEVESVFEHIATGLWLHPGNNESISGPGSTLRYTEHFRQALERFLLTIDCRSIFDAPCGDFNWMKQVSFPPGMRYFGADIVTAIVAANQSRYGSMDRYFMKLNIIKDPLPDADVWLCRDCLFHFSFEHARDAVRNGLRSRFKYYAITSHLNAENVDIETGSFRELNLEIGPFWFPKPLGTISDFVEGFPPRHVGIWSRDQILGALVSDRAG